MIDFFFSSIRFCFWILSQRVDEQTLMRQIKQSLLDISIELY